MKKPAHHRTLCKGCLHGIEHHPECGACVYGNATPTGGCRCPAFNTPKNKVPDTPEGLVEDLVGRWSTIVRGQSVAVANELEAARRKLQLALDEFSATILEIVSRGGVASTTPPPVDAVRSRGRALLPETGKVDQRSEEDAEVPTPAEVPTLAEVHPATSQGDAPDELGKGERACLNAIVHYTRNRMGCSEAALFLHTGYKSTSRATYVKALRGLALVETIAGAHWATEDGIEAAGVFSPPLPGAKVTERLLELGPGEIMIFNVIGSFGAEGCSTALLRACVSSLKETSRMTYLKALRSRLIVETEGNVHRLTAPFLADLACTPEAVRPKKPTVAARVAMWRSALPLGEGAVFGAIVDMGVCVGVVSIMQATGYKETSVRTYAKALKKRGLLVSENGGWSLAPELVS